MGSRHLTVGIIFLSQTGVGMLGNSSFFVLYCLVFCTGLKLRLSDHILKHLCLANCLVLLSKGIPQIMTSFGRNDFLDDHGCKFLFYVHRVAREVSLSSTCLLSVFQAMTVIPSKFRWTKLKVRAPKYIEHFCFLIWVLHLLGNILVPLKLFASRNTTQNHFIYCSADYATLNSIYHALFHGSIDVICLCFLMWTSGSLVLFLHRHKQQVKYIRNYRHNSSLSPETKATQSVLILGCTFVFFFTLSSISSTCVTFLIVPEWWILDINIFLDACFSTISPFMLICSHSHISRLLVILCERNQIFHRFHISHKSTRIC
ncbi:vomeronasal type-1 receptor 3-like [Sorex fumeus]|uniref:vomeronasal type-1 receptor 3-like n=1 Tax=Sorex fumeus TaxID=62283 RepID=UPI0024AE61DD|nr:vomeronasal type-1 receptor 3-like [Sorex fumeus]